MSIPLYFDQNVSRAIANGLRLRQVDVLTAYEDGRADWSDIALLDHATAIGRVLFTHDRDFLRAAVYRQQNGIYFAGVIFAQMEHSLISVYIRDLEMIAKAGELNDLENLVTYLPL